MLAPFGKGVAVVVADLCLAGGNEARCGEVRSAEKLVAVKNIRKIGKSRMVLKRASRTWRLTFETYMKCGPMALLTCEPAKVLPMAQRYFLFRGVDALARAPSIDPPSLRDTSPTAQGVL